MHPTRMIRVFIIGIDTRTHACTHARARAHTYEHKHEHAHT